MLVEPSLDELLTKVDSKFKLVTLALKRARQINNDDSIEKQYSAAKPVSMALQEIYSGEVFVDTAEHESKRAAEADIYSYVSDISQDLMNEGAAEQTDIIDSELTKSPDIIDEIADESDLCLEDFVTGINKNDDVITEDIVLAPEDDDIA
ncbi:DNA-directed RNA polymerase subunit omega [bacterium]|nr:DNA-directed RNA polymerase subunit omega [bacterium]